MTVTYYTRRVYGKTNLYVSDPTVARHVRTLTGRMTITVDDLRALRALGMTTEQVADPLGILDGRTARMTVATD